MSGGINSYRFRLQRKKMQNRELDKHKKLVQQLNRLGVKVNKPYQMDIRQLEMLVKCHRVTVEPQPDYVSKEHVKVAEANGLTKEDVVSRVDDLGWDVEHAISVKKRRHERRIKNQQRVKLLQEINRLEVMGKREEVSVLEKQLADL